MFLSYNNILSKELELEQLVVQQLDEKMMTQAFIQCLKKQ